MRTLEEKLQRSFQELESGFAELKTAHNSIQEYQRAHAEIFHAVKIAKGQELLEVLEKKISDLVAHPPQALPADAVKALISDVVKYTQEYLYGGTHPIGDVPLPDDFDKEYRTNRVHSAKNKVHFGVSEVLQDIIAIIEPQKMRRP
jgi:hypothetical protein